MRPGFPVFTLSIQRRTERPPGPDEFRVSVEAATLLAVIVVVTVVGTVFAVWIHRRRAGRRGRGAGRVSH